MIPADKNLVAAVLRAVAERKPKLTRLLLTELPATVEHIELWWEVGSHYGYYPHEMSALKILMNDQRFVFDAMFIAQMLYFTHLALRDTVLGHRRASRWVERPESLMEEYIAGTAISTERMTIGMRERFAHGVRGIRFFRRQRLRRVIRLLGRLRLWMRTVLEDFYAPGGRGYCLTKARFEKRLAEL